MTEHSNFRGPGVRTRAAGGLVALGLALAGCHGKGAGEAAPERGDVAAARVDGRTVWVSDVKREAIAQGLIGQGEPLDPASEAFHRVLDEVVDQRLLATEAEKRKLDKDPAVQRRIATARDRVLGDTLVESEVAGVVTAASIKGLYDEQQKLSRRTEEIRARQIVSATAADAEAVKKLLASGGSFEALAMERSRDGATRFNGGDLGYFTLDAMPEAYGAALAGARAGQLVGPFAVAGGFALLKVEDVRAEQPIPLEAARPQIVRFLTYDRIRDLLEKIRAKAKIELLIKSPASAAAGVPPADAPRPAPPVAPIKGAPK